MSSQNLDLRSRKEENMSGLRLAEKKLVPYLGDCLMKSIFKVYVLDRSVGYFESGRVRASNKNCDKASR